MDDLDQMRERMADLEATVQQLQARLAGTQATLAAGLMQATAAYLTVIDALLKLGVDGKQLNAVLMSPSIQAMALGAYEYLVSAAAKPEGETVQ